jgi:hypothetical protein
MNDLDRVLKVLGVEEVENPEVIKKLEERKGGGRESKIKEFLTTAPLNKWFKTSWNVGAIYREAKKLGIKIRATRLGEENYVKILERP